jgi:hypothetical protein
MALDVDWSAWPLVLARMPETAGDGEDVPGAVLDLLRAALERGSGFAVLVDVGAFPDRRRIRAAVTHLRAAKALRPRLAERCRGLAMVVEGSASELERRSRSGRRFWGCPTLATNDVEQARSWIAGQVGAEAG